jgi:aryl-alcohol dehydrogenase-like predicted oxidoreductase
MVVRICHGMDYFWCQLYSVEMVGKKKSREEQVKEIKYSKPLLDSLFEMETLCRSYGVDFRTACVAYVHSLVNIEQIIIGTASINNLKTNIKSADYDLDQNLTKIIDDLAMSPKSWTNPRNWT